MSETVVRMPRLADTLVEGTLARWLKAVGDQVAPGEPLAEIETDKVSAELPAPTAGRLAEILVHDGETVAVDTPLARITPADVSPLSPASPQPAAAASSSAPTPASADPPEPATAPRPPDARALTSPLVAAATADAPSPMSAGALTASRATVPSLTPVAAAPAGTVVPLSPMRHAIATHMTRSAQTIPRGWAVAAADLTEVAAWRRTHADAFANRHGAPLTLTVLFVRALARTLASARSGPQVHVGVAVAVTGGVLVPVLRNAHSLSLSATAQSLTDLAQRARGRKLAPEEMEGATMSLTNVGSFGNLTATPLIPLGQTGIIAPGTVESEAFPTPEGGVRPGLRCLVALVYDRRAFDDLAADRFLGNYVRHLSTIPDADLD